MASTRMWSQGVHDLYVVEWVYYSTPNERWEITLEIGSASYAGTLVESSPMRIDFGLAEISDGSKLSISDNFGGSMARLKGAAQADSLAAEAWAAGCREVQSAINWATAKGEVSGTKFQAAFRKVVAAQESTPPVAALTTLPTKSGADLSGDPGKNGRKGRSDQAEAGTQTNGSRSSGPRRGTKPEDDSRAVVEPAPRVTKVAVLAKDSKSATPADFVEDMHRLRHLVTKYGKKGLADLIGMLSD